MLSTPGLNIENTPPLKMFSPIARENSRDAT
jgi:hypothetical protein